VHAFGDVPDTLIVTSGGRVLAAWPVVLAALEPYESEFDVAPGAHFRVQLPALGLDYSSDPDERQLARPFDTDPAAWPQIPEVDRWVFEGRELVKARRYGPARAAFLAAIAQEPWNRGASLGLADLSYRSAEYDAGLEQVNRALQLDAYDAEANFIAGNLYRALGRTADARDAFGWAARGMAFRSAAYTQLSELALKDRQFEEATRYARQAIDYDRYNVPAWQLLAIVGRQMGGPAGRALSEEAVGWLLEIDPLHHFASAEAYLSSPTQESAGALMSALRSEYPGQTILELAIGYASGGLTGDAARLLRLAESNDPVARAWRAWLENEPSILGGRGGPAFVFPFRRETVPVLRWAAGQSDDWIWPYLLGLNLWAVDREDEAALLLAGLGDRPDFAPFYVARGYLLDRTYEQDPTEDLRRAVALAPEDRTILVELIRHEQEEGRWSEALRLAERGRESFPSDFNLDLLYARALINLERGREAVAVLDSTNVLPSENARESHRLYEQAHLLVALDAIDAGDFDQAKDELIAALDWPEHLGQGRPYDPEERLIRFLLGRVEGQLENVEQAGREFDAVVDATGDLQADVSREDIPAVPSLFALGRIEQLQAIADGSARDTDPGRFAAALARALAEGAEDPGAVSRELAPDYARLFSDLDGRLLLRALSF
jgi:tetratricopeptide (TPR) repeat protein